MSYYTQYNIKLSKILDDDFDAPITITSPAKSLQNRINTMTPFEIEQITDTEWDGMATWYDHENDLAEISKDYPDWLFTIHGNGEDSDDIWVTYIYDGLVQNHKLIQKDPPIDMNKWTLPQPTLDQIKSSLKVYKPNSTEFDKLNVLATILSLKTGTKFNVTEVQNLWDTDNVYTTVATEVMNSNMTEPYYIISTKDHYNLLNVPMTDVFMTTLNQIISGISFSNNING